MTDKPALLGGNPAVTIDQTPYTQWPRYGEEELEALRQYFAEGRHGSYPVPGHPAYDLELVIAKRWGVKHALNHNSGTSAIKTAVFSVGVRPGDEVIVQSAVHPFACLPIIGCGAVPVFADIDAETLTLDPEDVERRITSRTRAIVVVHWQGMPADMDALNDVAGRHGLKVVEDNCVSQGTLYRGKMCGTLGDAAAITFQDGKMTSAGNGGMFLTDSDEHYQRGATLGHYERLYELPDPKYQQMSGFALGEKYRMATWCAVVGLKQMGHWDDMLKCLKDGYKKLGNAIEQIEGFSVPDVPDYVESKYLRGWIRFDPNVLSGIDQDALIKALAAEGISVSSPLRKDSRIPRTDLIRALHLHPAFTGNEVGTGELLWEALGPAAHRIDYPGAGSLPVTESPDIPRNTITLPGFRIPADELIEQYRHAFEKIAHNAAALAS